MKSEEQVRKLLSKVQLEGSILNNDNSTSTMQSAFLYAEQLLKNILDEPCEKVYCCSTCNITHLEIKCPLCHNSNVIKSTADLIPRIEFHF